MSKYTYLFTFIIGVLVGVVLIHPFVAQPEHSDRSYNCSGLELAWIDHSPVLEERICIGILREYITD